MEQIDREDKASRTTFRLAVGAAAAALVAAAGLTAVLLGGDDKPDVQNPGNTSSTTPTTDPQASSMRDWDFLHRRTYTRPCPSVQEALNVPVTDVQMKEGGAELGSDDMVAELADVVYSDLDGDGDEDALVLIWCHSAAEVGGVGSAWAGAYRENSAGDDVELFGTPLEVPYVEGQATTYDSPTADGKTVSVRRSATRTDVWAFDGTKFVRQETEPPVGIHDVDFENRTYPKPCPSIKDADIPFDHGSGDMDATEEFRYSADLAVSYGDLDGDGAEDDAMVVIFCHHMAAESAAAWAAVYTVGADGQPQLVGTPLEIPEAATLPYEMPAVDGTKLTVKMETADIPNPAPTQVWQFDGSKFVKQQ